MSADAAARRPYHPSPCQNTDGAARHPYLRLAKVTAADFIFDEAARRNVAQIVNPVRRIRADVETRPFRWTRKRESATRAGTVTDRVRFIN